MLAIQKGDRAAVEPLVRRYHRPLLAYFHRLGADYHLAQDLAQECLFRLVARAHLYRYPQPLKPWLFRIAVNLWRDHVGSAAYRHARRAVPLQEAADAADGRAIEEEVGERLLAQRALAALASLPPPLAEVLVLRLTHGLTVPEIAAALDLPEGTVKSRLFHGLRHLRARMRLEEVSRRGRR